MLWGCLWAASNAICPRIHWKGSSISGFGPYKTSGRTVLLWKGHRPDHIPVPQATIEFELEDVAAVRAATEELAGKGFEIIHAAKEEPWGQTVARFLSPEGLLIGLSFAPWMHEDQA